jgi:hypothetical protein
MTDYTTNGTYHFLVNYNNDIENPIGIPFIEGDELNISEYQNGDISCDYIKSISIEDDKATIEYVLGADKDKSGDTGIHYMEKLNYFKESATTFVDGFKCDIFYEKLDYDTNLRSIYNYEYDLYSDVRIAKITKMTLGDVWNSGSSVNLPLVTKEGMSSLYSSPKFDIDMIFNRGNGAGWEKHFKLSECNTMKDLENYGNNFFNL